MLAIFKTTTYQHALLGVITLVLANLANAAPGFIAASFVDGDERAEKASRSWWLG